MMRLWPALDLAQADDLALAAIDEFAPTAVEEREPGLRVFFATAEQRDGAWNELTGRRVAASAVEVCDQDWAARSQRNLTPVTVAGITILPDPHRLRPSPPDAVVPDAGAITIVIEPSMGFGTGHHATTRLCLAALQSLDFRRSVVLDIGTGSGILAIASARLGASRVHAIDFDADAVQSAVANLALNPDARQVSFALADLASADLPPGDVVLANLTGAVLSRSASRLLNALTTGGTLVVSGILASEEDEVRAAFAGADFRGRAREDEWICLVMTKR